GKFYVNSSSKQSTFSLAQINHGNSAENAISKKPTTVAIFGPDGRWKLFEANTPEIAHTLKMDYQHLGAAWEALSKFRKMRQAFTTGPAAPWQAAKNLAWEATMVPTL